MNMSTYVKAIKSPGAKWEKMKAIWDSCEEADIDPPDKVCDFFEGGAPDDKGVVINLTRSHECCQEWGDEGADGYEVDISKLPKDVIILRFYNSW